MPLDPSHILSGGLPPNSTPESLGIPSRNPLPLSATQEAQVREVYNDRVRRYCQPEIKAFAECVSGRSISIAIACRPQNRAMNECLKAHSSQQEHDAARVEWFATRMDRVKANEEKAKRAGEQKKFLREWWQIEETEVEKEQRLKDEVKRARKERIGGLTRRDRGVEGAGGGGSGGSGDHR